MLHILQFTHTYLESTLVISDALLGLAFGSITTYFVHSNGSFPSSTLPRHASSHI